MRVVFVSNYINHHQIPFCEAMRTCLGDSFVFIQTEEMEEERLAMGWKDVSEKLSWVLKWDEDRSLAKSEIMSCDILIAGWAPKVRDIVENRLALHRPVFKVMERIYKDGQWKAVSPRGLLDKYREYTRFRREPFFLLCAGAYVASDFHLIGAFPGKKYCWGYFPPMISYEDDKPPIRHRNHGDVADLIWAGRFVEFKHVERALTLAKRLSDDGKNFLLHIVGDGKGPEEASAQAAHGYVLEHRIEEHVVFHGFCSPEEVRRLMEQSDIFIFTSDHGEGWGAVLNEAMNSGCAPVADAEAGAVPFLVKNGVNGYIYTDKDEDDLVAKAERLIDDTELCERFASLSYRTITTSWNAGTAARRFLDFANRVLDACDEAADQAACAGRRAPEMDLEKAQSALPAEGPMSPAPLIRPFFKAARMADR